MPVGRKKSTFICCSELGLCPGRGGRALPTMPLISAAVRRSSFCLSTTRAPPGVTPTVILVGGANGGRVLEQGKMTSIQVGDDSLDPYSRQPKDRAPVFTQGKSTLSSPIRNKPLGPVYYEGDERSPLLSQPATSSSINRCVWVCLTVAYMEWLACYVAVSNSCLRACNSNSKNNGWFGHGAGSLA